MKKILGSLRLKVMLLAVLAGLTFQMVWNTNETKACEECIALTGALCVGCITGSGHTSCTAIQETCSCNVSGSCGGGEIGGEGGGG